MISDIFYDLEYCANNKKIEENELFIFLKSLAGLSVFYMLLVREDEDVKEKMSGILLSCLKIIKKHIA